MSMKITFQILLLFYFSFYLPSSFAMPQANPVPGGIVLVQLDLQTTPPPQVRFQNKPVAILPYQGYWTAVIGIPLDLKVGVHPMQFRYTHEMNWQSFNITISPKTYRTQYLNIKDKNKVNPNEKSSQRIIREMKVTEALRNYFSQSIPNLNFIQPVKGRDSGRFGSRRVINRQARSPHSGMDIAARTGTLIRAPQAGRILYTGNLFFTGNTIFIDHGQGVISLYAHLNRFLVKAGQEVKQGQIIGHVGKTGRVTGPHLHWSIYLNGAAVDPALFLRKP